MSSAGLVVLDKRGQCISRVVTLARVGQEDFFERSPRFTFMRDGFGLRPKWCSFGPAPDEPRIGCSSLNQPCRRCTYARAY